MSCHIGGVRVPRLLVGALAVIVSLSARPVAAQTWVGPGVDWNTPSNWSPAIVPNSPTAAVSFTGTALGNVNISANVQAQSLSFSNSFGTYTLTSNPGVFLSAVTGINIASNVTTQQVINLANLSGGNLFFPTGNNLTITNNSTVPGTTLVLGANTVIGTPGSGGVIVSGAGRTEIAGTFASVASGNHVVGGLTKNGTGTLILSNANNVYFNGTNINGGTLQLGSGTAIPTGSDVTVASGAQFNIGAWSNNSATAIGNLTLNGGTFRVPTGGGDYFFSRLTMTGGTVDFTGTNNFWLHFAGSGVGVTTNSSSITANWIGAPNSRIQNDGSDAVVMTVNSGTTPSGIDLDAGIILSSGGSGAPFFYKFGAGVMRLTNPGNTASFQISEGALRVDDMAALGSGAIQLTGGTLQYGGATAASSKPLSLISNSRIQVLNNGTNLTLTGGMSQVGTVGISFVGPDTAGTSSTFTLAVNNSYSGPTSILGNAIVALSTIANGGAASPLGFSSNAPTNLQLGNGVQPGASRGTLLLTGTNPTYTTDRGATLNGSYEINAGGAINVQNAGTNLTWDGQLVGSGSLIKTGQGMLTLSNTTNSYNFDTYIESGTLKVSASGAIPAISDVNVNSGATFLIDSTVNNLDNRIDTLRLNGGTVRIPAGNPRYWMERLETGPAGGTVNLSGSLGILALYSPNSRISVNGNSTWIGGTGFPSGIQGYLGGTPNDFFIAPNVTLNNSALLYSQFRITGGGTLYMTTPVSGQVVSYTISQGKLRVDDLSVDSNTLSVLGSMTFGRLMLDGGTLQYSGPTATSTMPVALLPVGGAVEVSNPATTLTLTGAIGPLSGGVAGPFVKAGPGALILNNLANTYVGGITVSGGRLDVSNDAQLGVANPTVNGAGILRYTANNSTGRTFSLVNGSLEVLSSVTLTHNGAAINGGFLRGSGTNNLAGGTALTGVTTFTNTNLNITGPASITNFAHNGNLTVVSGATLAMNYGTNGSAGRTTINGTANVSEFVSNGLLTVPNGGLINNTGSNMVLGGGSTTFVGSVANPGGKIDLGGNQLIVRGGLLVTNAGTFGSGNGVRNGTTVADFGALVKGTGPYQSVITQNGGQYLPGNSPGTSEVGDFAINGGGGLIFQITDAGPSQSFPSAPGVAGANPGWGLTKVFTSLNFTATPASPYTITMQTQQPPPAAPDTPGLMSSFDPSRAYQWLIFDLQPGASFTGTFDPSAISFATAQFVNSMAGGTFSLSFNGTNQVFLNFTPVPEPGAIVAMAFGGLGVIGLWRRRRRSVATATVVAVSGALMLAQPIAAQTWIGPGTNWNTPSHWSPAVVPNSPAAAVSFTGAALGTVNISSNVSAHSLSFGNLSGGYTLTSSPGVSLNGVTQLFIGAGVTGTQTINLANISGGSLLFASGNNLTIDNNSTAPGTTLVIGPNTVIGTPGSGGVIVNGSGATEIAGTFASVASGNHVVGGLTKNGTGMLVLSNPNNVYFGGTVVNGGTLQLGAGTAIPTNSNVTVASGAQFNIGNLSNSSATAIGNLTLNGGTFRVPSGAGDYYLNQLTIAGGTVEFTGTSNFWLHFAGAGAGINLNSGINTWIGSGNSRIQNDTGAPLTINVNFLATLNAGIILSSGGSNSNFNITGGGNMRLSNTGNTANIFLNHSRIYTNDLSTNVGSGAYGTLGNGNLTLFGGELYYDGPSATSAKPIVLEGGGVISVQTSANLTLNGVISESVAGSALSVFGEGLTVNTLSLTGANSYTGRTSVSRSSILAIPTIANGGVNSPIGASSTATTNLSLGGLDSRGTLLLTGTNPTYATDRGAGVNGLFANGGGGVIAVQNATTNLNWSGQITDTMFAASLIKSGAGTLTLTNGGNNYTGGTFVEAGKLALGPGGAMPIGAHVTVFNGAEFNIGTVSNAPGSAIGAVALNGGTLRVPSGNGDYYLNRLEMTGGTVDFTGTSNFWMHFTGAGAGITNSGSSNWIGAPNSRIQNDTGGPLSITMSGELNAGIILSGSGANPNFIIDGFGQLRLSNTGNTANISLVSGFLFSNDLSTNVGFGAFGTLGTGAIKFSSTLVYDGASAMSSKPLTLELVGAIQVNTANTNLTMNGVIGQSVANSSLVAYGTGSLFNRSTLTLTGSNSYTGGNAVGLGAYLAVADIGNAGAGGVNGPLGASSNAPGKLRLGVLGRGDLLLTGTNPNYSTDRGVSVEGQYTLGYGGGIGVQNAGTTLTWSGQITELFGAGSLIKTGAGTLELNNNTNNFTGGAYVEAGTLKLAAPLGIPPGGNLTVSAGAEFHNGGFGPGGGNAIGTVTLNGGTFRSPSSTANNFYYMNKLVMNGGVIDATGAVNNSGLALNMPGASITVNSNSSWIGPAGALIGNVLGGELPINITPNATLTSSISLASFSPLANPFLITGGGTLHLTSVPVYVAYARVRQARLRMDELSTVVPGFFDLTLDNGTLAYGGPTQTWAAQFATTLNGGTIEVINAANTLTLTGAIGNGGGPLTKTGPGTLILDNVGNVYSGGIVVNAGRLDVGNDDQLGVAAITVNPAGTIRFTNSTTTARSFTMFNGSMDVSSGVNLAMNSAAVNGGFLRGTGAYNVAGNSTLTGVTTFTSTTMNVTGPAAFTNFANNGNLMHSAGQTMVMNYATNTSAGRMTINGTANVSDFVSNGLLTVPAGGLMNNSVSNMVLGGGSRTFVGSVANPGGKIDLGGQQLLVAGGLLVTNAGSFGSGNGVRNGVTVADFGALVKGTGPYQSVITQNGGQYLPGNSPGTSEVGDFAINGGGGLIFQITDAGPSLSFPSAPGVAGMNPGWGLTKVFTSLNFTATPASPYTITMQTQQPPPAAPDTPGLMSSFDPTRAYQWLIFDLQPGASFTGTFDPSAISFATAQFVNSTAGGTFSLSFNGTNQVFLNFTPVPEPMAILAVAFGGLLASRSFRRKRTRIRGQYTHRKFANASKSKSFGPVTGVPAARPKHHRSPIMK